MAQDFDFLIGSRKIHNLYLKGRLRGSTEWIEFEGRSRVESLLDGLGNLDRYMAMREGQPIKGMNEDQQWGANCAPSSVL
jgi:hypothetical protein